MLNNDEEKLRQKEFELNESNRQKNFEESENIRNQSHLGMEQTRGEQHSEIIRNQHQIFENHIGLLTEKIKTIEKNSMDAHQKNLDNAKDIVSKLQAYQDSAKSILGIISIDSHAAAYKDEADRAKFAKHVWFVITGLLFFVLVMSAYYNSKNSTGVELTWINFVTRWAITVAIVAAVTFSARQANKQERIERENRNMQLQMATIDPYLEIFDEAERKEIKKNLVDRIFIGVDTSPKHEDDKQAILPIDINKIIETVSAAIIKNGK